MDLKGRTALVTGGGRGIGRATCKALAERGLRVAVNYLSNRAAAEETAAAIRAAGGEAAAFQADVSDPEAVRSMVEAVEAGLGPVDVLINNAGITTRGEVTLESWRRVLEVNLTGAFICTRAVLPGMLQRKWGRIVSLSSTAGVQGAGEIHYCASKAGIIGFTMALARQVAAQGITVNVISPALVDTEFHPPAQRFVFQQNAKQLIPVGRLATADEVGRFIADLIGHPYITGENVLVAGGVIMG
ncbi:MAG: SDR family NAD(P)-dependent oxidoreductase [Acetobacteraceae bacterium]|nr:SDR family NAD(P)-dependent oxidoreductase [Acetobacteraceae bacterium]